MSDIIIRKIEKEDDLALAKIIRAALSEFGADHPGTVYYDPTTDNLSGLFKQSGSVYFVAERHGEMLGGAGIFPTDGLPADTCELVKMYLSPAARGQGLGATLIESALSFAVRSGYKKVYLESMPELERALGIYEKFGFAYLDKPLGNTGHFGCSKWMIKDMTEWPREVLPSN